MRERFVRVTTQLLDLEPRAALVLADIGMALFRQSGAADRHPDRVVNVGIREQLLVSVAAGMALEGFRPVVHTYAPFLVERAFEQIKLDFGHQGVGGVFVSVGASFDAAASGRTHQAPEDVPLIATLPGWSINVPGHPDEAETILREAMAAKDGVYVRLSDQSNSIPVPGSHRLCGVRAGSAHAPVVIAVGPVLDVVLEATADLDVKVAYTTRPRPFDAETLLSMIDDPTVITVEPYQAGTVALAAGRALRDRPHRILPLGVPVTEHRHYGSASEHARSHGLDARGVGSAIQTFLDLKRPV